MPIPAPIQQFIDGLSERAPARYDDLRAVIFNGSLKRSPEPSQTDGLLAIPRRIFEQVGVTVDEVRTADRVIPPGVCPDMAEHGYDADEFPEIYRSLVAPADIIILAGPIWLGDQSSLTRVIVERLYAYSGDTNERGQWSYYGKVGGVLTTGNEDGGKHVNAQLLYALQHIGLTVPPQAETYWVGEAGAGPVVPRPRARRPAQRVDHPQRGLHGVESPAHGAHAARRRRHPRPRDERRRVGPLPARSPEPEYRRSLAAIPPVSAHERPGRHRLQPPARRRRRARRRARPRTRRHLHVAHVLPGTGNAMIYGADLTGALHEAGQEILDGAISRATDGIAVHEHLPSDDSAPRAPARRRRGRRTSICSCSARRTAAGSAERCSAEPPSGSRRAHRARSRSRPAGSRRRTVCAGWASRSTRASESREALRWAADLDDRRRRLAARAHRRRTAERGPLPVGGGDAARGHAGVAGGGAPACPRRGGRRSAPAGEGARRDAPRLADQGPRRGRREPRPDRARLARVRAAAVRCCSAA